MLIHNTIENWRDALDGAFPDEAEADDELAAEFRKAVLGRYIELGDDLPDGLDYETTCQQRVGAFVLIQRATEQERAAFEAAFDAAVEAFRPRIADVESVPSAGLPDCCTLWRAEDGDWLVGHAETHPGCKHAPTGGHGGRPDGVTPCNRIIGRGPTAGAAIENAIDYFHSE